MTSLNRIQKLLYNEYSDFEDMVLIESPFAETTRDGKGLRQVQLGLTPTKMILASEVIEPHSEYAKAGRFWGTLELISVLPVECVNLSVFRRRKRNTLKAHLCNNRVLYFELAEQENRKMMWNLWCERVHFLSPDDLGSSHSETSVGSTTSASTLYIVNSTLSLSESGHHQIWNTYASVDGANESFHLVGSKSSWRDKNLYLGPAYHTDNLKLLQQTWNYGNIIMNSIQKRQLGPSASVALTQSGPGSLRQVNRFGSGVSENCSTSLFLKQDLYAPITESPRFCHVEESVPGDVYCDIESGVSVWEHARDGMRGRDGEKHKRHYAFAPQPHFMNGLGPWRLTPGDAYSVQLKKVVSMVNVRKEPDDEELRLSRHLAATISCEALHLEPKLPGTPKLLKLPSLTSPAINFWTPDYWYRPGSARSAYIKLHSHLDNLRNYQLTNSSQQTKPSGIPLRWKLPKSKEPLDSELINSGGCDSQKYKAKRFVNFVLGKSIKKQTGKYGNVKFEDRSTIQLRKLLRIDIVLTTWDFDSTTLAYQLTMIDRELFLKVPTNELSIVLGQKSTKDTPNIGAMVAFAHRVSCLVATEILKTESVKMRARLIARYINVADKTNRLHNLQSTRSVLCGLQSPPVYRLRKTWAYLRAHHATKNQRLAKLSRLYRDPRLHVYQTLLKRSCCTLPYLPDLAYILSALLNRIPPQVDDSPHNSDFPSQLIASSMSQDSQRTIVPKALQRFFSAFHIWPRPTDKSITISQQSSQSNNLLFSVGLQSYSSSSIVSQLSLYFAPVSMESSGLHPLAVMTIFLNDAQKAAANYALLQSELAKEFLLKTRYREDKDNFRIALKIESPEQSDNA